MGRDGWGGGVDDGDRIRIPLAPLAQARISEEPANASFTRGQRGANLFGFAQHGEQRSGASCCATAVWPILIVDYRFRRWRGDARRCPDCKRVESVSGRIKNVVKRET